MAADGKPAAVEGFKVLVWSLCSTGNAHDECHKEDHKEKEKQDFCNSRRRGGNATEAENRGYNRDKEENQGIMKHVAPPV